MLAGILCGAILLIDITLQYIAPDRNLGFLATKQFIYHIKSWRWSFFIHVFSSSLILLSGLLQFNSRIIHKLPKLHRISGYIYLVALLCISGPASFIMALYANGGLAAQIAFVVLSSCWMGFTLIAYLRVLKKDYVSHGEWLLRSYALTLSALTLRLYLFLISFFNLPIGPKESYILVSYLSWIPNLLIAEILIKRGFIRRMFKPV